MDKPTGLFLLVC